MDTAEETGPDDEGPPKGAQGPGLICAGSYEGQLLCVLRERAGLPGAFFLDTGRRPYPRPEPKEINMSKSDPETPRGPMGDARPDSFDPHKQNESGQKPQKLEDRPSESTVRPEDYPEDQRTKGA